MAFIKLETEIHAPQKRCFDLSRSIDLHKLSTAKTHEEAIAGKMTGLIGLDETVKWRARHFGIWQTLTVKITDYQAPSYFKDEMTQGIFKVFEHQHYFESRAENHTFMIDELYFRAPLGLLGTLVEKMILTSYLRKFLLIRNQVIKEFAETDKWKTVPGII